MDPRLLRRIGLAYLAVNSIWIGAWALLAPRSFYDGFPGGGRAWVSVDGPFNEHLVRDFGALNLAFAVVALLAAVRLERSLTVAASLAALVWGVPHLLYHLINRDGLATSDLVTSLVGLAVFVGIPIALLIGTRSDRADVAAPVG